MGILVLDPVNIPLAATWHSIKRLSAEDARKTVQEEGVSPGSTGLSCLFLWVHRGWECGGHLSEFQQHPAGSFPSSCVSTPVGSFLLPALA